MTSKKVELKDLAPGQVWADSLGSYLVVDRLDSLTLLTLKEQQYEYSMDDLSQDGVLDLINGEELKLVATSLEAYYSKPVKKKKTLNNFVIQLRAGIEYDNVIFQDIIVLAMDVLGLQISDISNMFSTSNTTVKRWISGKSKPHDSVRIMFYKEFLSMVSMLDDSKELSHKIG